MEHSKLDIATQYELIDKFIFEADTKAYELLVASESEDIEESIQLIQIMEGRLLTQGGATL